MENIVTLTTGQKIEVLMQDEVSLDIDCSLRYIESGKKEIENYVEDISKERLNIIVEDAKEQMDKQIKEGIMEAQEKASASAKEIIDENMLLMKEEFTSYINNDIKPEVENAKSETLKSAGIAEEAANSALSSYNSIKSSLEEAKEVASGNIGDIKYTLRSIEPYGGIWCDGRLLSEEQYPDLYQMLLDERLKHVSSDEYETQISESGCCYSFVVDEINQTIKVPTIPVLEDSNYRAYVVCYTGKDTEIDITQEITLNNPFSLLDYKWSEYELNNASWLLSNGTFHSGATYVAVYELLLKIYNGTETKDGVSVKLSTEDYTDTDFVINTSDITFRLPIKVKLASGNMIVGNGMTLGLTNGTQYSGLNSHNGTANYFLFKPDTYGANVSTSISSDNNNISGIMGVTTDPLKSGIETSSSGLKLYFYVGETIQDANVINASGVLIRVADLSDSYISGLGMPSWRYIDLTLGASGTQYTAPANGWFYLKKQANGNNQNLSLQAGTMQVDSYAPSSGSYCGLYMPVKKDTSCSVIYSLGGGTVAFRFIYAGGE